MIRTRHAARASCAARAGTPPCIPPSPSALLALASDALWRLAGENGLSDARFGAVVSTYRAAEHLYDLAEALAGGLPLDHPDVVLSLRGAMWRLSEMEGAGIMASRETAKGSKEVAKGSRVIV